VLGGGGAAKAVSIISTDKATPSWFGASELPVDEVIACENGLVHWPRRELYAHTPRFYVHHAVPFAFNAIAPKPKRWLRFLGELWGSDTDSIEALQEVFGYALSGDTRQQKMFLLVGPKRGGKGTIARVLKRLIGVHSVAGPTLASFATNFGLQDLVAKSLAVISDARLSNKTDHSIVAERLLSITGEDTLTVDRKYLPHWTGQLPTRILMLTNELPSFSDASGACDGRTSDDACRQLQRRMGEGGRWTRASRAYPENARPGGSGCCRQGHKAQADKPVAL
jgi:putative DNA primase/helicase